MPSKGLLEQYHHCQSPNLCLDKLNRSTFSVCTRGVQWGSNQDSKEPNH